MAQNQFAHQFIYEDATSDGSSSVAKRKGVGQACDECRRRKKRCQHGVGDAGSERLDRPRSHDLSKSSGSPSTYLAAAPAAGSSRQPLQETPASRSGVSDFAGRLGGTASAAGSSTPSTRFVGHLNPETTFLTSVQDGARPSCQSVGVWDTQQTSVEQSSNARPTLDSGVGILHTMPPLTQRVVLPLLEDGVLTALPPLHHLEALERFYFDNINPLLPLLNEIGHSKQSLTHPARILRSQGICLLASTNFSVSDHLCLGQNESPLSPAEFGRITFSAMRINMEVAFVTDKLAMICAWTMMSLYSTDSSSQELSSQAFVRAVQMTYTMGLHHKTNLADEQDRSRLFCCVWVLDKLQAAMHGRPILIHQADIATLPAGRIDDLHPGFSVLLRIAMLLDAVIALYRPRSDQYALSGKDFPDFETLVLACNAATLPAHLLSMNYQHVLTSS